MEEIEKMALLRKVYDLQELAEEILELVDNIETNDD